MAGLLNPPVESAACRQMIEALQQQLEPIERDLARVVLEREKYLIAMGEARALRAAIDNLTKIYERTFNT